MASLPVSVCSPATVQKDRASLASELLAADLKYVKLVSREASWNENLFFFLVEQFNFTLHCKKEVLCVYACCCTTVSSTRALRAAKKGQAVGQEPVTLL